MDDLVAYLMKKKKKSFDVALKSSYNAAMRRAGELRQLLSEAKLAQVAKEVRQILSAGHSALVFTCYVDTAKRLQHMIANGITDATLDEIDERIELLFKSRIKETTKKDTDENWDVALGMEVDGTDIKPKTAKHMDPKLKAEFKDGDIDGSFKAHLHIGETSTDNRTEAINRFKAKPGQALVCTIQTGGVGLNLTEASYAVFVDLPWTPAEIFQGEGRIHRIGQERETFFVRYFATGTYDDVIMTKLAGKQNVFDILIGASEWLKVAADEATDTLLDIILKAEYAKRFGSEKTDEERMADEDKNEADGLANDIETGAVKCKTKPKN
jgi:superfamily II DNA or RNA helicase